MPKRKQLTHEEIDTLLAGLDPQALRLHAEFQAQALAAFVGVLSTLTPAEVRAIAGWLNFDPNARNRLAAELRAIAAPGVSAPPAGPAAE